MTIREVNVEKYKTTRIIHLGVRVELNLGMCEALGSVRSPKKRKDRQTSPTNPSYLKIHTVLLFSVVFSQEPLRHLTKEGLLLYPARLLGRREKFQFGD